MTPRVLLLIGAALLIAGAMAAPSSVSAHAGYESSVPAANEVVAESPARVDVIFTQDLVKIEGQFYVRVLDAGGAQLAGDGEVDDDNRRHVTTVLPEPLAEGLYVVEWFSTSDADGDSEEGSFCFSIVAPLPEPLPEACQEEPRRPPPATLAAETATVAPDSTPDAGEPTPVPTEDDDVAPDGDGTSTAVIVGIIVGVAVVVFVIGGVAVAWFRRSQT